MDINTRIANLAVAAACGPLVEQELLRAHVILAGPHVTNNPGASAPLRVVLHPDRVAYFKRFRDQRTELCAAYRHDRQDVPLNEVIAWRLAWAMGDPWAQLVPPSVLRTIDGAGGALTSEKRGIPDGVAVVAQAPEDVAAAAFWDALIGQQDRHTANFRFDATSGRLGLIDHGFSFRRDEIPSTRRRSLLLAIGQERPTLRLRNMMRLAHCYGPAIFMVCVGICRPIV